MEHSTWSAGVTGNTPPSQGGDLRVRTPCGLLNGGSFSGKTQGFDPCFHGSNPCPPTMTTNKNEYDRAYYVANKERREQIRARNLEQRERNRTQFATWLKQQSCTDCGNSDWRILQLDHLYDKVTDVSKLLRYACKWEKLEEEIAKCEVVCPNCHAVRTGMSNGSWRFS